MKINIAGILRDRFVMGMMVWAVALVLFFVFAIQKGKWVKIEEIRQDIKSQEKTLNHIIKTGTDNPSPEKIEACLQYKKLLEDEIQKCHDFYLESDKPFERWFPNVELDPAGTPTEGTFFAAYRGAKREIILKQLYDLNIKVCDDHDNEIPDEDEERKCSVLGLDDPTHQTQFPKVQKQFWIVKKLVDAVVTAEASKCGPIRIQYPAPPVMIPEDLGIIIPFEIKVYLPLTNAAKLLYYISDTSKGGPFLTLTQVKITRFTQQADEMTERTESEEQKGKIQPPSDVQDVKVTISGNIMDFGEKPEK